MLVQLAPVARCSLTETFKCIFRSVQLLPAIMKTTAKDLRLHARRILEAVDRGQEVTITHRGKPRAKLIPVQRGERARRKAARKLPLFGIWKDCADTKNVTAYVDSLRSARY